MADVHIIPSRYPSPAACQSRAAVAAIGDSPSEEPGMDSRPRERSCSSWFRRWHAVSASLASMVIYIIYLSLHSKSHSEVRAWYEERERARRQGSSCPCLLHGLKVVTKWLTCAAKHEAFTLPVRIFITGAGLSEFFPLLNVVQACQRSVCAQLRPFEHSIGI